VPTTVTSYFKPFSTLLVGVALGALVWPRVRGRIGA
jgi:hypothetical protein